MTKSITPFDLSQWSQLINVAGTAPTATDMRGTAVIGAEREWGALEYDPNLLAIAYSPVGVNSLQRVKLTNRIRTRIG